MKVRAAVAYTAPQTMVIEQVELEPPSEGHVLVRYNAAGLCHSDLHVLDGSRSGRFPPIRGHEAAGEVVECGPGMTRVAPGDPAGVQASSLASQPMAADDPVA